MAREIKFEGAPLYPKQRAAIYDPARIVTIEASTKAGKTSGCLAWIIELGLMGEPGWNYWWIAPIYGQAEIAFRRCWGFLSPIRPMCKRNMSSMHIMLPNGARLVFKSGDRSDDLYGEDVYGAVLDEACFAAGSLVDTPAGPVPIERLHPGMEVLTATGSQKVTAVRETTRDTLAVVMVAGRSLVCSVDHPFFTARGWVAAGELTEGDQIATCDEGMRILRNNVLCAQTCQPPRPAPLLLTSLSSFSNSGQGGDAALPVVPKRVHLPAGETADPAFLHALLCCEMETSPTRIQGEDLHIGAGSEGFWFSETLVGANGFSPGSAAHTDHEPQPYAGSRHQNESLRDTQTARAQTTGERRQRARNDSRASEVTESFGSRMAVRVRGRDRHQEGWGADALDNRHRSLRPKDRGRGGWPLASDKESQGARRSQRQLPGFVRVGSVAVHKSGSDRFAHYSAGASRVTLYDVEVTGHPAFSVEGLLVHNSRMREESWHAIRSTLTFTQGPARLIGNVRGRKNWFYRLARLAEEGTDGMAYHRLTAYDAVEAGVLKDSEIETARRDFSRLGQDEVFRQLYMAEALDDASNPFGLKAIAACCEGVGSFSTQRAVAAGVDLAGRGAVNIERVGDAESRDWTSICLMDKEGWVTHVDRFRKPHKETTNEIVRKVGRTRVLVDSTGQGDAIVEELQRRGDMQALGFTFTERSRQDLLEGLALAIQDGNIKFPDVRSTDGKSSLREELESFEFQYTPRGVRYDVGEGSSDDMAMALALCVKRMPWRRQAGMHPTVVGKPAGLIWNTKADGPGAEAWKKYMETKPTLSPPPEEDDYTQPVPVIVQGPSLNRWSGAG